MKCNIFEPKWNAEFDFLDEGINIYDYISSEKTRIARFHFISKSYNTSRAERSPIIIIIVIVNLHGNTFSTCAMPHIRAQIFLLFYSIWLLTQSTAIISQKFD